MDYEMLVVRAWIAGEELAWDADRRQPKVTRVARRYSAIHLRVPLRRNARVHDGW